MASMNQAVGETDRDRSTKQRCTDCCFRQPYWGAIFRWFCWTLWLIVILGDTFAILYIAYLLEDRDDHRYAAGACAIFILPWVAAWAAGLSIKEHIFTHKNYKCRYFLFPFATLYTVLPPIGMVMILLAEIFSTIKGFFQRFVSICVSPRSQTRYYEWQPLSAWWRFRRLTQMLTQTIPQLLFYGWLYYNIEIDDSSMEDFSSEFDREPIPGAFQDLLSHENDVLYAAAGISLISLIFGLIAIKVGASRNGATVRQYINMSQRVTPGFVLGENRKLETFDWSLFKFDDYSLASALKIIHKRKGKFSNVILTPKSLSKLHMSSCHMLGSVLKQENINLTLKHSVHLPRDVWRTLAKNDAFIPTEDMEATLKKTQFVAGMSDADIQMIVQQSMPGGGRLYYSQFRDRLTMDTPLARILKIYNPMVFSAQEGDERLLQLLLGIGHMPKSQTGKTALFHAIETMNTGLLMKIFEGGQEPTEEDYNLTANMLHEITQKNDTETAAFVCDLIKQGRFANTPNPILKRDQFGNTALHYAASLGRLRLVQLYVQAFTRAEREKMMAPNRTNETPISLAKINGQDDVVKFLMQYPQANPGF